MSAAPSSARGSKPDIVLDVRELQTHFFTREGVVRAVDGVSLQLRRGQTLGLVGESGSGKSVTGFSIMGLVDAPGRVVGGQVLFEGQDLLQLPPRRLRQIRGARLAMIFQDPMMTLNPVLRIETQMTEAIRAHEAVSPAQARERARAALAEVGIPSPDVRLQAYPHQLSGGMRQRVAIAIAMLRQPACIIADEPTTALDVTTQAQILALVQQLARQHGTALIWITHDLSVVAGLADELAVMYAGRIVEYGSVDAVLDTPQHPYTEGLLASLPASARGGRLHPIPGSPPDLLALPPGCSFAPRCPHRTPECELAMPPMRPLSSGQQVRCLHPASERPISEGRHGG